MKRGFTLIELLVSFAIFSLVIIALIAILVTMFGVQTEQSAAAEVNQQGQALLQQIQYYVSTARLVDMTEDVATSTLTLREFSQAQSPTYITLSAGVVYIQQGFIEGPQPLTSNNVSVSNLLFTRHYNLNGSSTAYGTDSVSFSFTVSAISTNSKQYTQSYQSSATTLAPVGKIAMIQQGGPGSVVTGNPDTMSSPFLTNNEAGDLLIAVITNPTTTEVDTVYDTAGNTWSQIANVTDMAYNEELDIFAAINVKGASNTVELTNQSDITSTTLLVYEYRGASASSSLDASSSQLQPNNSSPSSGLANPTATVELVFGANHDDNTAEVPSAGGGFTLETSSTFTNTFIEDSLQYITGPVAATWQYSGAPTSSAVVATFK